METHLAEECLLEGLPIIDHPQDGATIDGTSQNVSIVSRVSSFDHVSYLMSLGLIGFAFVSVT